MDPAIVELLERYQDTHVQADRDALLEHFHPLVERVVKSMNFPSHVERDDLIGGGMFGLIDAIDRFDTTKGWQFTTYASRRIRGAVIAELRTADWTTKYARAKVSRLAKAEDRLRDGLSREATDTELASELDVEVAGVHDLRAVQDRLRIDSLDRSFEAGGAMPDRDVIGPLRVREDPASLAAEIGAGDGVDAIRDELVRAITRLPEPDRLVLALYFFESMTMAQIGVAMDVAKARVCIIHGRAITRLQETFGRD